MNENGFLQSLSRNSDVILAVAVISILVFMILPLPPFLLDILIAFNITFSVIILLISMYITSPLELSVFPGFSFEKLSIYFDLQGAQRRSI